MRSSRRWAVAALLLAGLAACDAPRSAATAEAARDTLAGGAERVRYGLLPDAAPEPLVPDLRIGVLEGEPPFVFGDVRGIEIGADGTIYVLDHQAAEVRAFEADGSFRGYLTRRGEGPGEILQANGLARAPDGTLWVQDHGQWQLIRLDPEGGEIERRPMLALQYGYLWDGRVDDEGRIWTGWSRPLTPSNPGDPAESGPWESAVEESMIVHRPATGDEDTIHVATPVSRAYIVVFEGGRGFRAIPFQGAYLQAVDPAGAVWSAMGDTYRVARVDAAGDTTLVIEVDHPAAPVTAADRDEFVAAARERGADEERIARQIARLMPERKPALSQLVVDDESRLWVRRFAEADDEPAHFDVFAPSGDYLGSIRLGVRTPTRFPPRIRDGRLYTLAVDEYDVPSVVRVPVELPER